MLVTLRVVSFALLAAALALPSLQASAQDYPSRPVRLIVPLGAGGPTDLVGRWLAQALGEQLKQSFFVENRPGAAGLIGTVEAAKSAPDGYTLLVVASPHINLEILQPNKPYQLFRDFVAVAPAFSYDALMVVHPSIPAKTVKEFIALAKSQPGKLTYASSGPGSNKHMGGELFKLMTGTDMLHVAYKGSTGARNDIIGGHVDMMFDEVPSVAPNVLERRGWVARRAGTDRRHRHYQISLEGRRQLDAAREGWRRAQERVRSIVGDPALSIIARATAKMDASVGVVE
jgi:tripartite-type tricarboxylate transporter receptor subunit TctC